MTKVRRQPTEPQDWAVPVEPLPPPEVEAAAAQQQQTADPFADMLTKEYHLALDKEIAKATNKIMERFTRLLSQEKTPKHVQRDALGNSSDDYENIVNAVHSGDPKIGATKEEVYQYLATYKFTEMRDLNAIRQQYQQPTT